MPLDLGITDAQREAMISLARVLLDEPSLDYELRRRITWVVWRIENPEVVDEDTLSRLAFMQKA